MQLVTEKKDSEVVRKKINKKTQKMETDIATDNYVLISGVHSQFHSQADPFLVSSLYLVLPTC